MNYQFAQERNDPCFAGGQLHIERSQYTEVFRFIKSGKEKWKAEIDTVHGDYGMFLGNVFRPLGNSHLLIESWYEHSRGGHSNATISVCNARQLLFSAREDIRAPFLFAEKKGRLHSILLLRHLRKSKVPRSNSQVSLHHELVEYEIGTGGVGRTAELCVSPSQLIDHMGLQPEEFADRGWAFAVCFNMNKAGEAYLKVSQPSSKTAGTLRLAIEASFRAGS